MRKCPEKCRNWKQVRGVDDKRFLVRHAHHTESTIETGCKTRLQIVAHCSVKVNSKAVTNFFLSFQSHLLNDKQINLLRWMH